jgi:hypothetical protein
MKNIFNIRREPLIILVSIGLAIGLLITGLSWAFPASAKSLFTGATWFWTLTLIGTLLTLTGAKLAQEQQYPGVPKPVLLLAVFAAISLVYLFPEMFAPGCNGMPRAFAACPAACRINTCSDWAAPGERGCNAKPPDKGCCFAYVTTCDPACSEPNPTPVPTNQPPTISGSVSCSVSGSNGWCKSGAMLSMSASDPQSFATTITGDIAGNAFSCAGPNCSQALPSGSGTIHFQASAPSSGLSSGVGNASFAFDPTPPSATLVISGTAASNGWYKSASVSTTGSDATSGVSLAQVSVNGGAWQASATLTEGTHSVVGRAIDNAGNTTTTPAQTVKVDATLPTISASVTSGTLVAGWYVTDVTFAASASDATSGLALIEHRLDAGGWSTGDSLTVVTEGVHTVDFRATDQAGLQATASLSVKLDKTPPAITFTPVGTSGANGWFTSSVSLHINVIDALSGVASTEYRIDSGIWMPGNNLALSDGKHTVEARATDKAGNLSAVSAAETIHIQVDTIAPSLTASLTGSLGMAGWYISDVTFAASASDATSGPVLIEYRLDGGAWLPGDSLTVSSEGAHAVDFRATDQAGLRSTASLSAKLDKTPPAITFTPTGTIGAHGWYISAVSLIVNALDVVSGMDSIETRLDGGIWTLGNTLTLGDGKHTVGARAIDKAGNLSAVSPAETIGFQVDTTAPSLTISLSGKPGLAGWYVSDVTVSANVSDVTSGIALTEYMVDGGGWLTGDKMVVSSDGPHTVDFRTTDQAGNQTTDSRSYKIDQTLPVSKFTSPLEGSTGTLAQGLFTLDGQSRDATSGLAAVQISTDNGLTWIDLVASSTGDWKTTWDTKPLPNGLYPVLARAHDIAGNIESTARVTLLLANHAPKVSIQESWWIWEAGSLGVSKRFLPVTEIRMRIACLDGQPDVKQNFTPDTLPSALSWDRKCGQGQFATTGDHPVTLTACDGVGNCASATGVIRVPFIAPPVPTWTPTVEPSPTPMATATTHPTTQPTAQITALPTIVPSPVSVPVVPSHQPAWLAWLLAILFTSLLALALAAVLDPRPGTLRRLGKTLDKLASDDQG